MATSCHWFSTYAGNDGWPATQLEQRPIWIPNAEKSGKGGKIKRGSEDMCHGSSLVLYYFCFRFWFQSRRELKVCLLFSLGETTGCYCSFMFMCVSGQEGWRREAELLLPVPSLFPWLTLYLVAQLVSNSWIFSHITFNFQYAKPCPEWEAILYSSHVTYSIMNFMVNDLILVAWPVTNSCFQLHH